MVEAALRAVAGVEEVSVSLEGKCATVRGSASVDAMLAAVNATGKPASLMEAPEEEMQQQQQQQQQQQFGWRPLYARWYL